MGGKANLIVNVEEFNACAADIYAVCCGLDQAMCSLVQHLQSASATGLEAGESAESFSAFASEIARLNGKLEESGANIQSLIPGFLSAIDAADDLLFENTGYKPFTDDEFDACFAVINNTSAPSVNDLGSWLSNLYEKLLRFIYRITTIKETVNTDNSILANSIDNLKEVSFRKITAIRTDVRTADSTYSRQLKNQLKVLSLYSQALTIIDGVLTSEGGTIDTSSLSLLSSCNNSLDAYISSIGEDATIFDSLAYGASAVVLGTKKVVSNVQDSYENHGWAYDVAEYGKCALKGAKAIVQIVGGAVSIATGAGIPMGILSIIPGVNDICNVAADCTYISLDAYGLVGTTNALKNTLTENGGIIGEYFGNKELGEFFGELTYTGIDVVTFLDSADKMLKSFGKVNTDITGTTGYSWVWGETSFDDVLDNKIKFKLDTKYIVDPAWTLKKVLGVDATSTTNFIIDAIDNTKGVYDKAQKLVEQLGELRKG